MQAFTGVEIDLQLCETEGPVVQICSSGARCTEFLTDHSSKLKVNAMDNDMRLDKVIHSTTQ